MALTNLALCNVWLTSESSVHGWAGNRKQLGQIANGMVAVVMQTTQLLLLSDGELGLLAPEFSLRSRDAMPSRVRRRIRSASNSAKVAMMLKNILPIGSTGSYTLEPMAGFTPRATSEA